MEAVKHPYLEGVRCREDGAVFVPQSGTRKAHWTFGSGKPGGYRQVAAFGKYYSVHRLICAAFHGLCPEDKTEVDHINRDKSDNRPGNLRWVTHSENMRNRGVYAQCGISSVDDPAAYASARYANDPEYRKRHNAHTLAYQRTRYANDPEYRKKVLERQRTRYTNDPEHRERIIAYHMDRYANDPEFRERQKAYVRAYRAKKKKSAA